MHVYIIKLLTRDGFAIQHVCATPEKAIDLAMDAGHNTSRTVLCTRARRPARRPVDRRQQSWPNICPRLCPSSRIPPRTGAFHCARLHRHLGR